MSRIALLCIVASCAVLAACKKPPLVPDLVPRAVASADRLAGPAPLEIFFSAEVFGGDEPMLFHWDFGDGGESTEPFVTHLFQSAGRFDVVLRVTDADGDFDEDHLTVNLGSGVLTATLDANPATGRAPLDVQFSAGGLGGAPPYSYEWDFADGARSTLPGPTHTYVNGGQYDVRVTVTDTAGDFAVAQTKVTVASDDQPAAIVSATPTAGIAPLIVAFQGGAVGGDAPISFSWDFGDGNTSTNQSPSNTYQASGLFTATLTVLDATGDSDTRTVEITVTGNDVPSVNATATPVKGVAPLQVAFTATSSGGDPPVAYSWLFGDGSSSTSQNPTHVYSLAGVYSASVTVVDANSDTATDQVVIEVGDDQTPTVIASAAPVSGNAPLTTSFNAAPSGGNAPLTFVWDFGDGTTSPLQGPSHTYQSAGTYVATVQVTDADGDTDSDTVTITVATNDQPVVSASASPTTGRLPLNVSFFASALGGDAPISWQWTFGDGTPGSTTQNSTHTYATAGTYQAVVVATDADGDSDSQTVTIQVTPDSAPTALAFANLTTGIVPLKVDFTASVTGGDAPFTYAWDFGDGAGGTTDTISHTYQSAGTYTVILTVTDADSDTDTDSLTINAASNSVPAVSVTATPTSGASPLAVAFDSTVVGGDLPLSFAWDFGDSTTASVEDPSHTYAADGVYDATVVVTDSNGDSSNASIQILAQASLPDLQLTDFTVEVQGLQAVFRATVTNVGNSDSPGFFVDLYANRPTPPAVGDFGAWIYQDPLTPLESRPLAVFLTVGVGVFEGWIQVDAPGFVAEANEANNVLGPSSYEVFGPLIISELLYDPAGVDTGCFVELNGPPGTDLTNYSLVGINGATGLTYVTIPLSGTVRPGGFFVVAQDSNVDPAQVDLIDPGVNLQNGPDNLELRFSSVTVDAVGYGTFGGTDVFTGEGQSAPDAESVTVPLSLGRSNQNVDTDDNSADFRVMDYTTPGLRNPIPGDSCFYAVPITASVTLGATTTNAVDNYNVYDAANCGGATAEPDVVYAVSLLGGETLTAEILWAGPNFDTVLYLRSACTIATSELECNDDFVGLLSRLTYTASTTETVYLIVDGYGALDNDSGDFTLQLDIQ